MSAPDPLDALVKSSLNYVKNALVAGDGDLGQLYHAITQLSLMTQPQRRKINSKRVLMFTDMTPENILTMVHRWSWPGVENVMIVVGGDAGMKKANVLQDIIGWFREADEAHARINFEVLCGDRVNILDRDLYLIEPTKEYPVQFYSTVAISNFYPSVVYFMRDLYEPCVPDTTNAPVYLCAGTIKDIHSPKVQEYKKAYTGVWTYVDGEYLVQDRTAEENLLRAVRTFADYRITTAIAAYNRRLYSKLCAEFWEEVPVEMRSKILGAFVSGDVSDAAEDLDEELRDKLYKIRVLEKSERYTGTECRLVGNLNVLTMPYFEYEGAVCMPQNDASGRVYGSGRFGVDLKTWTPYAQKYFVVKPAPVYV